MSYERATDDLDRVLGDVLGAAAEARTSPPPPDEESEGHDPDRTVRAVVSPDGRITSVEIGPRAARLSSQEIAERAVAAVNAALDGLSARAPAVAATADLTARLREAQDLSVRQLTEYTESLRDSINALGRS
ncbi:YbaB/EbfC family nucleoid-associated protein [Actinomadura chibensis]|uniref:YbaB/EbfC family nucleoid-associated protein n=1 Tax=Actinomadura chibensis TaxID=392828 RepID=A0A5D0NRK5_9ACTN|nr:YbaB/EbfC family nucleoid-associated protein [Actinomadura chibensis]TYB46905.1 YbaB/EbfC family nucleoid-associated protein [Actinomadura chibensis]